MAVLLLAFVGAVQAKNLVRNSSFEKNGGSFDEWTQVVDADGDGQLDTGVWAWGDGSATITTNAFSDDFAADFGTVASWGWGGGAGAYKGVLAGAGQTVTMAAYVNTTGLTGNTTETGIDLCFFNGVPDENNLNPPTIGRVNLNAITGLVNFESGYDPNGVLAYSLTPIPGEDWSRLYLEALTPAGTQYMKFEIANNGSAGHLLFDNVVGTIPEPATIALLGLGGLALIRRKR
jgi:hypothetical protein